MPDATAIAATSEPGPALPRRLAVTAGAVLATLASRSIDLPLLDPVALRAVVGASGHGGMLSPVALHLAPFISAYLLVEAVALAHPRLRPLRHGSGRDRLTRAAWGIGVALAALQAWGVATYVQTLQGAGAPLLDGGPWPAAVVALTLVGGAIVTAWAAVLISSHGVGNGFAVLLAVDAVAALARVGRRNLLGPVELGDTAVLVAVALAVVVPLVVARLRRDAGDDPAMPFLTCGIAPVAAPTTALGFLANLAALVPALDPLLAAVSESTWLNVALDVALVTIVAAVLAFLFCPPRAVAAAFQRGAPGGHDAPGGPPAPGTPSPGGAGPGGLVGVGGASRRSVGLVVGVAMIPTIASLVGADLGIGGGDLVALAVVLAVALDLRAELAFRAGNAAVVCARPMHRVYAVVPALRALSAAGIPAFARARHYRGLFHFFAPWAPVELLVPPERAAEAAAICARVEVG